MNFQAEPAGAAFSIRLAPARGADEAAAEISAKTFADTQVAAEIPKFFLQRGVQNIPRQADGR